MSRIRLTFPDPAVFEHRIPVRITDLNYGNHLGHDTLVSLLHDARGAYFRAHNYAENNIEGTGIILADLAVTYKAQVRYGQTLRIEIAVEPVGSRGVDFYYRVTDADTGEPAALAKTGLLFFDYDSNTVASMPGGFKKVLETEKEKA